MSDIRVVVRSSVLASLRRQRALLALLIFSIAALLCSNGVIGAGVARYAKTVEYQSALNLIEISSAATSARQEITKETLKTVAGLPGVVGVYPWAQADLAISNSSDWPETTTNPGSIWATPLVPGLAPKVLAGEIPDSGLGNDEIALPHSVAGGTLDRLLGHQVVMEYTKIVGPGQGEPAKQAFRVVAIFDNSVPGEAGPTPSYLAPGTVEELLTNAGLAGAGPMNYTTAYVRTASSSDVPQVQSALSKEGFAVSSVVTQLSSLGGLFKVLSWAAWVFGGLLVVICWAAGGAIGSVWVQQRTREVGLLKAIGWRRSRITNALMLQLALVGLLSAIGGVLIGAVLSLGVTTWVSARKIELLPVEAWQLPGTVVLLLPLLIVPACVCLGGLRSSLRASRVDADAALRDL